MSARFSVSREVQKMGSRYEKGGGGYGGELVRGGG